MEVRNMVKTQVLRSAFYCTRCGRTTSPMKIQNGVFQCPHCHKKYNFRRVLATR